MQYRNPALEPVATGSHRLLTGLIGDIGARLDGSAQLSDGNIHEIRKNCKKLRGLLRLLEPALDAHRFHVLDRMIRNFARQLAGLRDGKVMLDTLDALERHFAPMLSERALAPLRETLLTLSGQRAGNAPDAAALREHHKAIVQAVGSLDFTPVDRDTLLTGITAVYRLGRRAHRRMEVEPDTGNGHKLRRLAKYQYYHLRMLTPWNETALQPQADRFHRLEETLGKDHDLAVLAELLGRCPELCPDRIRRELLNALIESRRIALMSRALRLARELYRVKPGRYRKRLASAFAPVA